MLIIAFVCCNFSFIVIITIQFPYFAPWQVKAAESISNILRHNIKPGVAYQVNMVIGHDEEEEEEHDDDQEDDEEGEQEEEDDDQ